MVTPSATTAEPSRTEPSRWAGLPRTAGWVLLGWWLVLLLAALLAGERSSSLVHLESNVASGEVDAVQIAGGLDGRGYSTVQVHWRRGPVGYTTEVIEARPRRATPPLASRDDVTAVITDDLGTRLTALQPDLRVERIEFGHVSSSFLGWRVPGWLAGASLVFLLAVLLLLVHGPQPWRATRWAWFWLVALTPVGAMAYLLLAGPTTLVRAPRDPSRRLTGGWAFLLALVLGTGFRSAA